MKASKQKAPVLAELCLALLPLIGWILAGFFRLEQFESRWILGTSSVSALISLLTLHLSRNSLDQNGYSVFRTVLFLIPTMEYAVLLIILFTFRHPDLNPGALMNVFLGLVFLVLGNCLPKTRPNPFFGVRTRWSLANRENWIQTSRISGRIWVAGGLLCWLCVILSLPYGVSLLLILIVALSPIAVSFAVYCRQAENGTWKEEKPAEDQKVLPKPVRFLSVLLLAGVLGLSALGIAFGGRYRVSFAADRLTIDSLMNSEVSLELRQIREAVLKNAGDPGRRTFGYSAFGVDVGRYYRQDCGDYLRFTQASPTVIELRTDDQTIVLSASTEQDTMKYWNEITEALKAVDSKADIENQTSS